MDGGVARTASAHVFELVNTVLRALRQQMLDDGWISELELQFAGPSPSEPVFDLKENNAANQWADEFDDHTGAQLPGELVRKGKMEEIRWVKQIVTDKGGPNRPKVRCRTCAERSGTGRQQSETIDDARIQA